MKRIYKEKQRNAVNFLAYLFLLPSRTPEFVEVLFVMFECFFFTMLVSSFYLNDLEHSLDGHTFLVMCLLSILIIIKGLFQLTLIRPFYVVLFTLISVQSNNISNKKETMKEAIIIFTCYGLIILNLIIDTLSRIEFDFDSINPHSETINLTKIFHYLFIIAATIMRTKKSAIFAPSIQWVEPIVSFLLFVILLIIKSQSACRNFFLKHMLMRFYALTVFYYLRNFIIIWNQDIPSIYQHLGVIIISQFLCTVIHHQFKKIQIESQIASGAAVKLIFKLLSYLKGVEVDENYENAISELIEEKGTIDSPVMKNIEIEESQNEENENMKNEGAQKNKDEKSRMRGEKSEAMNKIWFKVQEILEDHLNSKYCPRSPTYIYLLQAELLFWKKEIIPCEKLLEKTRKNCSSLALIERLCIYKAKFRIKQEIENQYKSIKSTAYEAFLVNEKVRILLIQNCFDFLRLWRYLGKFDCVLKKLSKYLSNVLKRAKVVEQKYQKLKIKCISTVFSYMDYLYLVKRNVPKANEVMRNLELEERKQADFKLENKIYLALDFESFESNDLIIDNVGHNVRKLLGYDRSEILGFKISIFLPSFFKEAHRSLIESKIIKMRDESLFYFKKSVFAKHILDYYLPCIVELRMVYNFQGKIMMEGSLEIINNPAYNWTNFFFIKSQREQLIEVGPAISSIINLRQGRTVHYSQYFRNEMRKVGMNGEEKTFIIKSAHKKSYQQICSNFDIIEGKMQKYLQIDNEIFEYDLLKGFSTGKDDHSVFLYYVCRSKSLKEAEKKDSSFGVVKKSAYYQKYPIKGAEGSNIDNYLKNKPALMKELNKNKRIVLILFIISIALSLCCFISEFLTLLKIEQTFEKNQALQAEFQTIIDHYNALGQLGMIVNINYIRRKYNYFYLIDIDWRETVILIQRTNFILSRYNSEIFQTEPNSVIALTNTTPKLVASFAAGLSLLSYLFDDKLIEYSQKIQHEQVKYLFGSISQLYINGFISTVISYTNQNEMNAFTLFGVICFCAVVIFIIIVKMDAITRHNEYQTLRLLAKLNSEESFISSINEYLRKITGDTNANKYIEREPDENSRRVQRRTRAKSTLNRENMSLAQDSKLNVSDRENSVREFFGDNFSQRSSKQKEVKVQHQDHEKDREDQVIRPRSKSFLIFWLLITISIILIPSAYFLYIYSSNTVTFQKSVIKLTKFFNQQVLFSDSVILYFDSISHENDSVKMFQKKLEDFVALENEQIIFQQVKFSEFTNFSNIMKKITYAYLCEYMDCDPEFRDYINIIFSTVIHKNHKFMTNNLNDQPIKKQNFQIRTMLYCQQLLSQTMTKVVRTYIEDYNNYEKNKKIIRLAFTYLEIAVLVIFFCSIVAYYRKVALRLRKNIDTLNIIREESYALENQE